MKDFDDDMMFSNIIVKKPTTQPTVKKADMKKQKYSQKMNDKRKRTLGKPVSSKRISDSSLFKNNQQQIVNRTNNRLTSLNQQSQNPKQKAEKKQVDQKQQREQRKYPNQERKPRLSVKDRKSSQHSYKKVSLNRRNREPQVKGTINLNPLKIKMQQIKQIQPQKDLSQIQKLDTVPISQLALHKSLLDSLMQNSIQKLTQIQKLSYLSVFQRKDTVIKAATGSGKTLAYLIPLINQFLQHKSITKRQDGTTVLVVCPTRQLCMQAQKQAMRCLKRLPFYVTGCLVGGQQTNHQKSRIRKGLPILFSTPGRLVYHLQNTKCFKLDNIKTLIFQEADRTLDMGFQSTVNQIIKAFEDNLQLRKVQKILVSAHFNEKVQGLIQNLDMNGAKYIGFDMKYSQVKTQTKRQVKRQTKKQEILEMDQQQHNENDQQVSQQHNQQPIFTQMQINTSSNLKQQYVLISQQQKIVFLLSYISVLPQSKIMIFVSTISQVEYIDYLLCNIVFRNSNGEMTDERIEKRKVFKIHGDLDQKLRTNTYFQFRKAKFGVMISTEVASRGLDFPDLSHIVLFDVPPTITDYGNRIGRSGRFNSTGVSLLLLHYQQSDYAQKIRYYNKDKPLEAISKDLIYENFQRYLLKLNIRDNTLHYLEGIVRTMVKNDDEKYQLARKAYVSMLRAYARLTQKHIFHVKRLNLKMLSRAFGLNNAQAQKSYDPKAKQSHFQTIRKQRKVQNVRCLQVSQYL